MFDVCAGTSAKSRGADLIGAVERVNHDLFLEIANDQSTFASSFWRGHSSVGRAPALQAGSQGFESPCLQSTLVA
jgi:hypothetical protein